jgi:molecular chaperone GrpE
VFTTKIITSPPSTDSTEASDIDTVPIMFLRSSSNSAAIRSLVVEATATTTPTAARLSGNHREISAVVIRSRQQHRWLSSSSLSSSSLFHTLRPHTSTFSTLSSYLPIRWHSSNSNSNHKKPEDDEKLEKEPEEANASSTTTSTDADDAANTDDTDASAGAAATTTSKEDELNAQIKTLKDQLLRSYAEQENIRHIARNDVQAANSFAIKKFAKSLLDVADNLDRALEAVGKENPEQQQQMSPEFQSFYQGIELTKAGLIKALESNGVTAFCEEPGDVFDPEQHEALMEYPDPTATPGTVGRVIKKGYMLNARVLRPAEVAVVKK